MLRAESAYGAVTPAMDGLAQPPVFPHEEGRQQNEVGLRARAAYYGALANQPQLSALSPPGEDGTSTPMQHYVAGPSYSSLHPPAQQDVDPPMDPNPPMPFLAHPHPARTPSDVETSSMSSYGLSGLSFQQPVYPPPLPNQQSSYGSTPSSEQPYIIPPSRLTPMDEHGFVVASEQGGSGTPVTWSELVTFLLDERSTAMLADNTLIRRMALFVKQEIEAPVEMSPQEAILDVWSPSLHVQPELQQNYQQDWQSAPAHLGHTPAFHPVGAAGAGAFDAASVVSDPVVCHPPHHQEAMGMQPVPLPWAPHAPVPAHPSTSLSPGYPSSVRSMPVMGHSQQSGLAPPPLPVQPSSVTPAYTQSLHVPPPPSGLLPRAPTRHVRPRVETPPQQTGFKHPRYDQTTPWDVSPVSTSTGSSSFSVPSLSSSPRTGGTSSTQPMFSAPPEYLLNAPKPPSVRSHHSHSSHRSTSEQQQQSLQGDRAFQPYQRPVTMAGSSSASIASSSTSAASQSGKKGKDTTPAERRIPRPLNTDIQHYVFDPATVQVYRMAPGEDLQGEIWVGGIRKPDAEVVTFLPYSYHRVIKDELEILPSDPRNFNDWLRGQSCVAECKFRMTAKRPATVRHHFITCKAREAVGKHPDPIKRLCELFNGCIQKAKQYNGVGLPPGYRMAEMDGEAASIDEEAEDSSFAPSEGGSAYEPDASPEIERRSIRPDQREFYHADAPGSQLYTINGANGPSGQLPSAVDGFEEQLPGGRQSIISSTWGPWLNATLHAEPDMDPSFGPSPIGISPAELYDSPVLETSSRRLSQLYNPPQGSSSFLSMEDE